MSIYAVGVMIIVSVMLIIYSFWPASSKDGDSIKRRLTGRRAQDNIRSVRKKAKESVAKRVIQSMTPIAVRPTMIANAEQISKLRMKLANAGCRAERGPTMFLTSKSILAVCVGLAAAGYAWARVDTIQTGIGVTLLGAGIGFMGPNLWLRMAIAKRGELLRKALPDTLDMLVISVEAGLGLDAAFQRVGDDMQRVHPALAEELQMVTLESQMGIPRSEALANFGARAGIEEAISLVGVVNQAERFGTSIAQALRRQSASLRVKRRQAAEEKAQKTTVKLMLPLIMFIFPAIFVVLGGPAALTMMEALKDTGLG